ncbi:MAG: potassium channel family protein [Bacillota bacterium]
MREERLQVLMIILALLVIPLLIIEQQATNPAVLLGAWVLNLLIWLAFVAEYLYGFVRAPAKGRFVRERWFDLAIIVLSPPLYLPEALQAVRSLRALRLFRLLRVFAFMARAWSSTRRLLGAHSFGYVLLTCALFVIGGGALFVAVEGRGLTLLDGIWWAVATLTTVGYGDVYPETDLGRLIALLIIITGLGLMATLTANIAARFVEGEQRDENTAILERLDAIAARLERLEARLDAAERGLPAARAAAAALPPTAPASPATAEGGGEPPPSA